MAVPVAEVAALARLIGLEIAPQYMQDVAMQLVALQTQAQLVLELDLDEAIEPAPVFLP
ncbi:MAG: DUF4089 domain-containing protein [Steroidobacteraceae bacterium]